MFSSLPYEIYQHILLFAVDRELSNLSMKSSYIHTVAIFQSLSKKINEMKEMKEYFDEFWWKVCERIFGMNLEIKELKELKIELFKTRQLRRKVILANYIKFKVGHSTYESYKKNRIDEIRIVVLGEEGVGKSSLAIYFVQNIFIEEYDPTIEDSFRKSIKVDGVPILTDVIDTAATVHFPSLSDSMIRTGDAFVIVCSANDINRNSLGIVHERARAVTRIKEVNDVPIAFVMNKMDLIDDSHRTETVEKFRGEINSIIQDLSLTNFCIVETSAKRGENVSLIFEEVVRRYRSGMVDNIALLQNVIKHDSAYIEEFKKGIKNSKQKCSLM